ncbi:MAG: exodeoxyribonuclease VII large subunit [Candidatus Dormibacteraeota bacterium]|nr:exodeoxyribonuclease VII large subunit [Candidatus Dormibacteraeota bacterium]
MSGRAFTVSELTAVVRDALSARPELEDVLVEGEISNFTPAVSGHLYFTLKDARAAVKCVCWRTAAQRIPFRPADGMTVIVHGSVSVYEQGGSYQLYVDRVEPSGVGALALAIEQLKQRLSTEGLFDELRKRPLPVLPRRVVVVTSRSGAAYRDVVTVTARRAPGVDLVLSPATVQGEGAADTVARALRRAGEVRGADVVLLVRGGGSIEDLMAFNSEVVARAIRASRLPVVTGIGHETDTTVADLAADRRAATPSAAAELVVPSVAQLREEVARRLLRLGHGARQTLNRARERTGGLAARLDASSPRRRLAGHRQELDARQARLRAALFREVDVTRGRLARSGGRLSRAGERIVGLRRSGLERRGAQLQALSPLRTLERGYSITLDAGGRAVLNPASLRAGDDLRTVLYRGSVRSTVTEIRASSQNEQMYDTEPGGSTP